MRTAMLADHLWRGHRVRWWTSALSISAVLPDTDQEVPCPRTYPATCGAAVMREHLFAT
jgi:hypothetical protein